MKIAPRWRKQARNQKRAKDNLQEVRLFQRRAYAALALVVCALLVLFGRLVNLQIFNHQQLTTLSETNRVRIQPLPPTRGLIYDRNGVLLADNLPTHRLEITLEQIDDFDTTLAELRKRITVSAADVEKFRKLRRHTAPYSGIPLRFRLSDAEVARLAVDLHKLPGVDIKAGLSRYYPYGQHTAHVLGYVGRIDEKELQQIDQGEYSGTSHIGKTGIEKAYEQLLHGQVGHQQVETNARGRQLRILQYSPPIPGDNLYLTLDIRLQQNVELALGDYNGSVVAIDPRNGEILALASMPNFDPNLFVNGIDVKSYRALSTSPDRPLFNRALRGTYPPGSTIKPFVGLAGLESGTVSSRNTIYCPGFFHLPGGKRKFRDWRRGGHGTTNVERAIEQSCDVYFYDLAVNLGIDKIHAYLTPFGLGQQTGIDLSGEKRGLLPSQQWKRRVHDQAWYAGDTLVIGIGQGFMLTTPLQLAHATAALAMQGRPFKPHLLHAKQAPASDQTESIAPHPLTPITIQNPDHWRYITHAMTSVVHSQRGTAKRIARNLPYTIAGKTGTAQVFSLADDEEYDAKKLDQRLHDHALFIAFAPAEDPLIAVAVIAENGGSGSKVAAPIARQVMDAYLLDQLELPDNYQTAGYSPRL